MRIKKLANSAEVNREISMLHELGLEEYEIMYLVSLKQKNEKGIRWRGQI